MTFKCLISEQTWIVPSEAFMHWHNLSLRTNPRKRKRGPQASVVSNLWYCMPEGACAPNFKRSDSCPIFRAHKQAGYGKVHLFVHSGHNSNLNHISDFCFKFHQFLFIVFVWMTNVRPISPRETERRHHQVQTYVIYWSSQVSTAPFCQRCPDSTATVPRD